MRDDFTSQRRLSSAGCMHRMITVHVDFFKVPLHSPNGRHFPAVRAVQITKGTVTGVSKTVGIPTGHVTPLCNGALGFPKLYLDQTITKGQCQPIGGHVLYPIDSPITTRLGLCSCLLYIEAWAKWRISC